MEAYSLDLRQRVCEACDEGQLSREEVAQQFKVSRSFVQKLLARRKSGGSIAAKPKGGGCKPLLGEQDRRLLLNQVHGKADATLAELCQWLVGAGGPRVSRPTMCRVLAALGLRLKKRRCMPASGTRRVSAPCGGIGKGVLPRWIPRSWFLWTKAGSIPQ